MRSFIGKLAKSLENLKKTWMQHPKTKKSCNSWRIRHYEQEKNSHQRNSSVNWVQRSPVCLIVQFPSTFTAYLFHLKIVYSLVSRIFIAYLNLFNSECFLSHFRRVTKGLPDTKYEWNPNRTSTKLRSQAWGDTIWHLVTPTCSASWTIMRLHNNWVNVMFSVTSILYILGTRNTAVFLWRLLLF